MSRDLASEHIRLMEGRIEEQLNKIEKFRQRNARSARLAVTYVTRWKASHWSDQIAWPEGLGSRRLDSALLKRLIHSSGKWDCPRLSQRDGMDSGE